MNKVCGFCSKSCEYSAWVYGNMVICSDCKQDLEDNEVNVFSPENIPYKRSALKELSWTICVCLAIIIAAIVYVCIR